MLRNMTRQYCKGKRGKAVKITDGTTVRTCQRALSVFYATMRKNKWDESRPRPSATEETMNWYLKIKGLK